MPGSDLQMGRHGQDRQPLLRLLGIAQRAPTLSAPQLLTAALTIDAHCFSLASVNVAPHDLSTLHELAVAVLGALAREADGAGQPDLMLLHNGLDTIDSLARALPSVMALARQGASFRAVLRSAQHALAALGGARPLHAAAAAVLFKSCTSLLRSVLRAALSGGRASSSSSDDGDGDDDDGSGQCQAQAQAQAEAQAQAQAEAPSVRVDRCGLSGPTPNCMDCSMEAVEMPAPPVPHLAPLLEVLLRALALPCPLAAFVAMHGTPDDVVSVGEGGLPAPCGRPQLTLSVTADCIAPAAGRSATQSL